ncbi:MAG: hypothetical protein E6R03_05225 [Hyphomicrobiaceae bacterium]|nr:MAG: hypothetical protein E6R03_05225 [Hyphomicrobiaceae bacterium]
MSESEHPEFDELLKTLDPHPRSKWSSPLAEFAKRTEIRMHKALQKIEDMEWRGIHSCHPNCQRAVCIERRRLKIATDALAEICELDTDYASMDIADEALKKIDEDRKANQDRD